MEMEMGESERGEVGGKGHEVQCCGDLRRTRIMAMKEREKGKRDWATPVYCVCFQDT